ncbi:ead/Ea22-like family protein [Salmonella enterica]|nr:ead/Ea22-like family protein [Salmonella enterica]ECP0983284.1 ead/Ea22-like family protein [Salmonella enterica]ECP3157068.1 ead/Ea22-like family protein [Salmonella enterica]ECP5473090.1 ead/Ea22-like family protein [Salmonella enterica]ECS1258875.1 ead/Ea22-like family protein [Salmonella enterica]
MSELEELNELLREKVKKLESDLWDKEQLRQVYSEKSFNLDSKVRELEARNQKDFVWRGNEISRLNDEVDELKEKLEAAERRIAETVQRNAELTARIEPMDRRITELEARKVNLSKLSVGEVMHMSGFSRDYAEGWCAGNDNAIHEIRAAGIKVKGE